MDILIKNCIVLPMDGREGDKYFEGSIGVRGSRIAFVADRAGSEEACAAFISGSDGAMKVIDGRGKLAMPGLVNIHGHVSMTLMRGYADDIPLMSWLNDHIWPFEAGMTGDDVRAGAELGIVEMLLGGTTTFVDMYWQEIEVAEAVKSSGIRAMLSPTFTDTRWDDFVRDFEAVYGAYGSGQHPRIGVQIAPHSVYSCSREHLLEARRLADSHGLRMTTHVSETLDEQHTMRQRVGKTPAEYLHELGMLDERMLAVHCVHVSESDMRLFAENGVSVAYNPHSNMKISSGIAPIARMLEMGINVGIGTDGSSSNNDLDMWEETRTGSFLQKVATLDPLVMPAYQALEMATVNGARALGMEDRIGRLKEGMLADIAILDIEKPHLYPHTDLIANLVYCAKCSDVDTVIVDGRIVAEAGTVPGIDMERTYERVSLAVKRIRDKTGS